MATDRLYEKTVTFTAKRYDGDTRETANVRFEVSPGCWVTVFDDGRVRFRFDPDERFRVNHRSTSTNVPGAHQMERLHKK
jgi:hypothetical protein